MILQTPEDQEDIQEALLALKEAQEQESIPFDEMKKRVGLSKVRSSVEAEPPPKSSNESPSKTI